MTWNLGKAGPAKQKVAAKIHAKIINHGANTQKLVNGHKKHNINSKICCSNQT